MLDEIYYTLNDLHKRLLYEIYRSGELTYEGYLALTKMRRTTLHDNLTKLILLGCIGKKSHHKYHVGKRGQPTKVYYLKTQWREFLESLEDKGRLEKPEIKVKPIMQFSGGYERAK